MCDPRARQARDGGTRPGSSQDLKKRRPAAAASIRPLALAAAAVAVAVPAARFYEQPASASPAQGQGVKFLMQYRGSLEGSYFSVQPVATSSNQFRCPGFEETRSIKSSVRPGKPYYLIVSKSFGSLEMEFFPEPHGSTKGVVNLERAAKGFLMT